MPDDALGAFARAVATEARELVASFPDPADGLEAVTSLLNRASHNPAAFMQDANAGEAERKRTVPTPADIWRDRARQVGGGR